MFRRFTAVLPGPAQYRVEALLLLLLGAWAGLGCRAVESPIATPISIAVDPALEPGDPPPARDFGAAPPSADDDPDGLFAYTAPGELPRIDLITGDGTRSELPLRHTDVSAEVRGGVARVRLVQQFHNDRREAVEVTYTFPLPENAAVDAMRMRVGERLIEAEVETRERARETFDEARAAGQTAALLEQERPNVFTQSLTNIPPGETIEVELAYLQTLTRDGGLGEFVFPMVIGPRFIPGEPSGTRRGAGMVADTDEVPDASRVTPPILGEGLRSGHDVSLSLTVESGRAIERWHAPTHTVIAEPTATGFAVELADAETIPNRDFVIRWQEAGAGPRATLHLGPRGADGFGHFALEIVPPALELDELVGRREMIFVVDRSGSMSGVPLALAKQTLRVALERLRPVDTFDVIGFEGRTERLFGTPRPANRHNLVLAERFIDGMEAGGGTMMADAVEAALAPSLSEGRHRYVFFLTDGNIGNEHAIIAGARALVDRAEDANVQSRVFGLGIGSAPNRHLIEGLSAAGEGLAIYVGNREHPGPAVDQFHKYIDHRILDEIEIDWAGLDVSGMFPSEIPDLHASHTVVVYGLYRGRLSGAPRLTAQFEGGSEELPVTVIEAGRDDRILATSWAREKIAETEAAMWDGEIDYEYAATAITALGLHYHLVTAHTSFVAVDRSRVVGGGEPDAIVQPIHTPEDFDGSLGGPAQVIVVRSPSYDTAARMVVVEDRQEARRLPVGASASRDFTAVVDMAPVGSPVPIIGGYWEEDAKLEVVRLTVAKDGSKRKLRRSIEDRSIKFEACYLQRVDVSNRGKHRVRYRLHFDRRGQLVNIEQIEGSFDNASADGCMEVVLGEVVWDGLPPGAAVIELELQLKRR